jgi:hypothetical protein
MNPISPTVVTASPALVTSVSENPTASSKTLARPPT